MTLALLVPAVLCSFSQSADVVYLKPDGSKTLHSDSANSYIMYGRAENDSLWYMRQYSMDNMIMTSGFYADEAMSVPYGKFAYYQQYNGGTGVKYDFEKRRYDTTKYKPSNYVSQTGFYVNGKRQGKWQLYNEFGTLREVFFYHDDKISGPARYYTKDGKQVVEEGMLKDGLKEGDWRFYSPKGALMGTIRFYKGERQGINNKLNSKELSVRRGMPDYDLMAYITNALRARKLKSFRNCSLTYSFHLNKDGSLNKPEVIDSGCNIELDVAIGEIMLNAPAWDPAKKEGQIVEATAVIFLQVHFNADNRPTVLFSRGDEDDNIYVLSPNY